MPTIVGTPRLELDESSVFHNMILMVTLCLTRMLLNFSERSLLIDDISLHVALLKKNIWALESIKQSIPTNTVDDLRVTNLCFGALPTELSSHSCSTHSGIARYLLQSRWSCTTGAGV